MADRRICSADGCDKPVHAKGICNTHYYRLLKHGNTETGARTPLGSLPAFIEQAAVYKGSACLRWPYGHNGQGYGVLDYQGRRWLAHRLVCQLVHGEPPSPEHHAAHNCGNGHLGCINPRHLRWATSAENNADKLAHGTLLRGSKCGWAKLSECDVRAIRALRGMVPQKDIASRFGIDYRSVWEIQTRKKWAWLE